MLIGGISEVSYDVHRSPASEDAGDLCFDPSSVASPKKARRLKSRFAGAFATVAACAVEPARRRRPTCRTQRPPLAFAELIDW